MQKSSRGSGRMTQIVLIIKSTLKWPLMSKQDSWQLSDARTFLCEAELGFTWDSFSHSPLSLPKSNQNKTQKPKTCLIALVDVWKSLSLSPPPSPPPPPRVSVSCSPTYFRLPVAKDSFWILELPAYPSQVLELRVCRTTTQFAVWNSVGWILALVKNKHRSKQLRVRSPPSKLKDLRSISRTHVVEERTDFPKLSSALRVHTAALDMHACHKCNNLFLFYYYYFGTGEVAQHLRILTPLPEDTIPAPSTSLRLT